MSNENENKELEFDPTESEAFYENLEAALEVDVEEPVEEEELPVVDAPIEELPEDSESTEEELPELVFAADLFEATEEELADAAAAQDELIHEETPEESEELEIDDELFYGVDAALTEQIENEFGNTATTKEGFGGKVAAVFKMIPGWTKVLVTIILVILLSVGFLFGTDPGRTLFANIVTEIIFGNIEEIPDGTPTPVPTGAEDVTPGLSETPVPTEGADPTDVPTGNPTEIPTGEPTQTPDGPTEVPATPTPTLSPTPTPIPIKDSADVINVLLLGVENIYGATYGRTDAILLASVNKKTGELAVVSFARDTWVQIPGRQDDRLNAAYAYGGANLIVETIELNFRVDIDSYAIVKFDGFMEMIDDLGGIKISLTAKEAEYLNGEGKAYISNPKDRNVVAGPQMMTGSQVLGYCRIRKVETITTDGQVLKNDFGRNYRHRVVLKALFDKYKEKNFVELLSVMEKCLGYVAAPNNLKPLAADGLKVVIEHRSLNFDTLQIPAKGYYEYSTIGGKDVITALPKNVDILQKFLYGEED